MAWRLGFTTLTLLIKIGTLWVLAPIGMMLFGYALMMLAYLAESGKAKNLLLGITQGRILEEQ